MPSSVANFYLNLEAARRALGGRPLAEGHPTTALDILLTVMDNQANGKLPDSAAGRELLGYTRNQPGGHLLPGAGCDTPSAAYAAAIRALVPTSPEIRSVACCYLCGAAFYGAWLDNSLCPKCGLDTHWDLPDVHGNKRPRCIGFIAADVPFQIRYLLMQPCISSNLFSQSPRTDGIISTVADGKDWIVRKFERNADGHVVLTLALLLTIDGLSVFRYLICGLGWPWFPV